MKRVTILRDRWLSGEPGQLLNSEGKLCVWGFVLLACGVPAQSIHCTTEPAKVQEDVMRRLPAMLQAPHSAVYKVVKRMMHVNDARGLTQAAREQRLAKLARRIGLEFVFTDRGELRDSSPAELEAIDLVAATH